MLSKLIYTKELKYIHPEMINHPEQAYLTNNQADIQYPQI